MEIQSAAWATCKGRGIDPTDPPDVERQSDLGQFAHSRRTGQAGSAGFDGHHVRPKNSAEVRWKIEPQGLLKDSPLCDDATPIPAHRGRRLDEPTPTGCH